MFDGGCHYCGRHTYPKGHRAFKIGACREDQERTRDHVIPKARGGCGVDNYVNCCFRCNQAKSDSDYESFKAFADVMLRGAKWRSTSETRFAYESFIAGQMSA